MASAESLQYQWRKPAAWASWYWQECVWNLILKVPDEIPDSLTSIHIDRTYDDKLINYSLFQRDQRWYLRRKVSGSPCDCSGCLRPRCIQNNDLDLYVQGLLLLKEQLVVDTKLRFCLSARCVNGISSSYNNIRSLSNKSVLLTDNLRQLFILFIYLFIYSFFNVDNYRTNTVYNKKIAIKC